MTTSRAAREPAARPRRSRDAVIELIPETMRELMEARSHLASEPWMQLDLTVKQMKVLFALYRMGPARPSAIAAAVGVSPASTTGFLDRLVEQGFIARETDPDDRRAQLIRLTETGTSLIGDLFVRGRQHLRAALEQMSDADLRALDRGLSALRDATRLAFEHRPDSGLVVARLPDES